MNKYFEAVKKGGDHWAAYLPEDLAMAHARNDVTINPPIRDSFIMHMAEKYPDARREFQVRNWG